MKDYVEGILEGNEATESYHGVVFCRQLTLRSLHNQQLIIDDPNCLSDATRRGERVQLVVLVTGVNRVRAFTQSRTASGKWSGTVRQLEWEPAPDDYAVYDPLVIEDMPMSIIGTLYGHVLLPRVLLGGVHVGTPITWGTDSFQLVAIYP